MNTRHKQRGYTALPWLFNAVAGYAASAGASYGTAYAVGAAATAATAYGVGKAGQAALAPKTPGLTAGATPPTVDQATQQQNQSDRLRLRRGVLANIYGGSATSAPLVGTAKLLGG